MRIEIQICYVMLMLTTILYALGHHAADIQHMFHQVKQQRRRTHLLLERHFRKNKASYENENYKANFKLSESYFEFAWSEATSGSSSMYGLGKNLDETNIDNSFTPEEMATLQKLLMVPAKRGFRCRTGFTYNVILRNCVPSLGALRGRRY